MPVAPAVAATSPCVCIKEDQMIRLRNLAMTGSVALLAVVAAPAWAAPCAGFVDVQDTDQFCANIQWIKNRGITLGCNVGGTLYCPLQATDRGQMAAFLNRLGNTLTPTILTQTLPTGPIDLDLLPPDPAANVCKTGPYTVADYPRRAIIYAQLSAITTGSVQIFASPSYSTDGGATFTRIAPLGIGMRTTTTGATWGNVTQTSTFDLEVGTTYTFAYLVQRAEEDLGTADVAGGRCNMTISIISRTGATSPLDAAVAGTPDNAR
jgi:hypothetical protein